MGGRLERRLTKQRSLAGGAIQPSRCGNKQRCTQSLWWRVVRVKLSFPYMAKLSLPSALSTMLARAMLTARDISLDVSLVVETIPATTRGACDACFAPQVSPSCAQAQSVAMMVLDCGGHARDPMPPAADHALRDGAHEGCAAAVSGAHGY